MLELQSKQRLVKKEINKAKKGAKSKPYTLSLSDLVMMQMVGNFEKFLDCLPNKNGNGSSFNRTQELIEKTRGEVTTHKLFPGIVQKTIEAQFGDKHAVLRELGQNAIDSYESKDYEKPVTFKVSKEDDHFVLKVRDFGCGMDLDDMVKNLLIPYNSGKEFDPTKIGEHGIGWYSVVDLANLVKVTSKKRNSNETVQAIVYNEGIYNKGEKWKADLIASSRNGFTPELNKKEHGTEIAAYIPDNSTSKRDLKNFLFQHLGMVEDKRAEIIYENNVVNAVRDSYDEGAPVQVKTKGKTRPLVMGVSNRELDGDLSNPNFKHRNKNLEKILFTQRGLFVKYGSVPFDNGTIHSQLINDLMAKGMDFWVDIPEHITLTKGRNNIIADHGPAVLDGMYKAFESVFLDVLLNDESIIMHQSQFLQNSVANMFDKNYKSIAKAIERGEFTLKHRTKTKAVTVGSKVTGTGLYLAKRTKESLARRLEGIVAVSGELFSAAGTGLFLGGAVAGKIATEFIKYPFVTFPRQMKNSYIKIKETHKIRKEKFKEFKKTLNGAYEYFKKEGISGLLNNLHTSASKWGAMRLAAPAILDKAGKMSYTGLKSTGRVAKKAAIVTGIGAGVVAATTGAGYGAYMLYGAVGLDSLMGVGAVYGAYHIGKKVNWSKLLKGKKKIRKMDIDDYVEFEEFGDLPKGKFKPTTEDLEDLPATEPKAKTLEPWAFKDLYKDIKKGLGSLVNSMYKGTGLFIGGTGKLIKGTGNAIVNIGPNSIKLAGATGDLIKNGAGLIKDGAGVIKDNSIESLTSIIHKCGLYVNVEEKREGKRSKQRKKIAKKYLSELHKNDFFKKIMSKEIVTAISYSYPFKIEHRQSQTTYVKPSGFFTDLFKEMVGAQVSAWEETKVSSNMDLAERDVKISIDDMIDYYLKGNLKYEKSDFLKDELKRGDFKEGDYYVDFENPIVKSVVSRLEEIGDKVRGNYDVKVLEDRLNNMAFVFKELAVGTYLFSGLGIAHIIINDQIEYWGGRKEENDRRRKLAAEKDSEEERRGVISSSKVYGGVEETVVGALEYIRAVNGDIKKGAKYVWDHKKGVGLGAAKVVAYPFKGTYSICGWGIKKGWHLGKGTARLGKKAAIGSYKLSVKAIKGVPHATATTKKYSGKVIVGTGKLGIKAIKGTVALGAAGVVGICGLGVAGVVGGYNLSIKAVKKTYDNLLSPVGRVLDPRKYPKYAKTTAISTKNGLINGLVKPTGKVLTYEMTAPKAAQVLHPRNYGRYAMKVGTPIVKILNPMTYFRAAGKGAEFLKKDFNMTVNNIKRNGGAASTDISNFNKKAKFRVSEWWKDSKFFEWFGYGSIEGDSFEELDKKRLRTLVKNAGVGQAYINFMEGMEELDKLVAKALGRKPFDILLSYDGDKMYGGHDNKNDHGLKLTKDKMLDINLNRVIGIRGFGNIIKKSNYSKRATIKKNKNLISYTYATLDMLIHQRAHEESEVYKHINEGDMWMRGVSHEKGFHEIKNELRKKVVKYIVENDIDLLSHVHKSLPGAREGKKVINYITPKDLSYLAHMTRRKLADEKENKSLYKRIIRMKKEDKHKRIYNI